ncbi:MAG: sugar phosphate isomerase/epimerase family protein [Elusimicrobiota bacterium]
MAEKKPIDPAFSLGINTGFAVNRYSEPEEWTRIVGALGLKRVQLTADMLNPDLPGAVLRDQVARILRGCRRHGVAVTSTFTGGFTRVNHLAHPDKSVREHWIRWFKRFADLTADLGAASMGSHFGIFTHKDNSDPKRRAARRKQNIAGWHEIGAHARKRGLSFLSWEPMSIGREQGETIAAASRLNKDVNRGAPLPMKICLDVDHGDVSSKNPADTDPYAWLSAFGGAIPQVHLKQTSSDKRGHWPFTARYNAAGLIRPERVLSALRSAGSKGAELLFEFSFREREPADSTVVKVLRQCVDYWRPVVPD